MNHFLIRLVLNVVGLYLATFVPGIGFAGPWWGLVIIALVFGLVNALLRPLLLGLSCLINVLTLGLFTFVINALMLMLTAYLSTLLGARLGLPFTFAVDGFVPALIGAFVISLVSFVLSSVIRENKRR